MHAILIGYGSTGRVAAQTLLRSDASDGLVVVDTDLTRVVLAERDGARSVLGDGAHAATLRAAHVAGAVRVLIAVPHDVAAVRITSAVRLLNPGTLITTLIRDRRHGRLARQLGADQVVPGVDLTGRLLGRAVRDPTLPDRVSSTLRRHPGLVVTERAVRAAEVGRTAHECGPLVLAVVRNGTRLWCAPGQAGTLRRRDCLLILSSLPFPSEPRG